MKISIVMAFYNRQKLLDKTLESIDKSLIKDYELIIVDDASDEPLVCERAHIIRIEPKDKWYHNPCIPFNRGFRAAQGDVIVIQNPECYHVGDILAYVQNNIKRNLYLAFGCYAINGMETELFHEGKMPDIGDYKFAMNSTNKAEYNGWYNHNRHRPVAYHFCSAITREDMFTLGGFDERYAHGVAFDDNEFIRRIKKKMAVSIIHPPFVIHQYHHHFQYEDIKVWRPLHEKNQTLFNRG